MSDASQVLLVENDADERGLTARSLAAGGWRVSEAATAAACLAALRRSADFVVLLGLPDVEGRELVARIAADHPETPAVVLSPNDDLAVAIDAMRRGAWDYVVKRQDHAHLEGLSHVVKRALERRALGARTEPPAGRDGSTRDRAPRDDGRGGDRRPRRPAHVRQSALAAAWKRAEPTVVGRLLSELVQVPGDADALTDVLQAVGEHGRWSGELRTRGVEAPQGVWDVTLTPIESPAAPRGGARQQARPVVGIFRT
jgi:CheY-like chemotaxis protein